MFYLSMYFLRFTMQVILAFPTFILMLMNLDRYICLDMNMGNARMTYIVKRREYIFVQIDHQSSYIDQQDLDLD
jgi:hypothetical protein